MRFSRPTTPKAWLRGLNLVFFFFCGSATNPNAEGARAEFFFFFFGLNFPRRLELTDTNDVSQFELPHNFLSNPRFFFSGS